MNLSLSKYDLQQYVSKQLNYFFPDNNLIDLGKFDSVFDLTINRIEHCFQHMVYERYNKNGQTILNHLYSDQYLIFLWFLANTLWKEGADPKVASKLYYLNKSLHTFDCMYDTELPNIFFISHGIGTMLGKAKYEEYVSAMHGCTVGSQNGNYPKFGKRVTLTSHSSVIGNCLIGENVSISNNTSVFERDIPPNTLVYNDPETGKLILKESKAKYRRQVFREDLGN